MHAQRSRNTVILTLIASVLALFASIKGVMDENLYKDVFLAGYLPEPLIGGSIAQDIVSVPLVLIMGALSVAYLIRPDIKTFILNIGLATYTFYAFGLYTIQGQYTSIYIIYLAIFSISFYSIIIGLMSFKPDEIRLYVLPQKTRLAAIIFLSSIILVLLPLWVMMMTQHMVTHVTPDTYGVFVLDLGFVFPAVGLVILGLLVRHPYSAVLGGIALIKVFTVCLSWAFGQWYGPYYGDYPMDYVMTAIPTVLTLISLVLTFIYLGRLQKA